MSDQDKDAVLEEFTEAYKAVHGKKPKIDASNGWYSVNGDTNQRLAQIEEWTKELKKESKKAASKESSAKKPAAKKPATKKTADKKPAASATKKQTATKQTTKKPAAKSAPAKKSAKTSAKTKTPTKKTGSATKKGSSSGQTPAQVWSQRLAAEPGHSRLPRGFK